MRRADQEHKSARGPSKEQNSRVLRGEPSYFTASDTRLTSTQLLSEKMSGTLSWWLALQSECGARLNCSAMVYCSNSALHAVGQQQKDRTPTTLKVDCESLMPLRRETIQDQLTIPLFLYLAQKSSQEITKQSEYIRLNPVSFELIATTRSVERRFFSTTDINPIALDLRLSIHKKRKYRSAWL